MPKNSKLKDTTCKRSKCFARSKDGKCSILYDADFGDRKCPFCKTEIAIGATRCPNCTSVLELNADVDLEPETK